MHERVALAAPPALRAKLQKLGLVSADDLILHLPLRYEDETQVVPLAQAPWGEPVQLTVQVVAVAVQFRPRRQLVVRVRDGAATPGDVGGAAGEAEELVLRFLNFYDSQTRQLEQARDAGHVLRVFGEIRPGFFGPEMVHPRLRVLADATEPLPDRLTPVYPTTAGVSQTALRRLIAAALAADPLDDPLPASLRETLGLQPFAEALRYLHAPPPGAPLDALDSRSDPAWRRIKFDELLTQQLSLRRAAAARRSHPAPVLHGGGELVAQLLAALPFSLTAAQLRVIDEIAADLARPWPMQRLLQGDVGSGKTIVAAVAACQAIACGWQAAFMAPTEILAEQHFLKLSAWLEPLGVRVVWLTGSLRSARKRQAQAEAAAGAQLVVGTHALIQDEVDFARLGVAIIDEQHRFGVAQRLALRHKGGAGAVPHQLMMSATPIPRTLAMSYYADLDVSVIDTLPPGRTPIRTRLAVDRRRDEVVAHVRAAVAEGRQAYWVCPLIEESEKLDLQAAIDTHAALAAELPELAVGLVHGRLKAEEKAATMAAFAAGVLNVLVATTVIEVGVDVPNATLMVIEHAERFGLAQLHQLRGRVGRGAHESFCVLLYAQPLSQVARQRLRIIFENTDGFAIAREDLRLRGPGEFIGSRQSGMALLRYADLETDADLVEAAATAAGEILARVPQVADALLARWIGRRGDYLKA